MLGLGVISGVSCNKEQVASGIVDHLSNYCSPYTPKNESIRHAETTSAVMLNADRLTGMPRTTLSSQKKANTNITTPEPFLLSSSTPPNY